MKAALLSRAFAPANKPAPGLFKKPVRARAVKLPPEPGDVPPHFDWARISDMFLWDWYNDPYRQGRKQGIFHPSAGLHPKVGNCERALLFDLLMADKSRTKISAKLAKVFENGHDRHAGLQRMFTAMAERKHMGVIDAQHEVLCQHETLPLSGRADTILTIESGYRYLFDYKTMGPDEFAKTFEPTFKHRVQLTTYMAMAGVRVGYMIYENKKGQDWAGPMERFRVVFNVKLWAEITAYCNDLLIMLRDPRDFPEYDDAVCKRSINMCPYEDVCLRHRGGLPLASIDKRDAETKKRHLPIAA